MDIEDLMREGPTPAIGPDAGHRRRIVWTIDDAQQFVELLRAEFPNVFLYEDFGWRASRPEMPQVRIVERVDDIRTIHEINAILPYRDWKPDLVQVESSRPGGPPRWVWARYVSPQISFHLPCDPVHRPDWHEAGRSRVRPFEAWVGEDLMTSYRRELPEEKRALDRIIGIARKLCVLAVPVAWESEAAYLGGNGRVLGRPKMPLRSRWATPATIKWCRAAADRVLDGTAWASGGAYGYLPPELVPDSWWGDIAKPKWARRG
jgi:hypothetical protein